MWVILYKALITTGKNKILQIMPFVDYVVVTIVTLNELHIFFK